MPKSLKALTSLPKAPAARPKPLSTSIPLELTHRGKGRDLKRILGRSTFLEMSPEVVQDKRLEFMQIWSDPTDGRTEADIAKALGVSPAVVRAWRTDPEIMATVERQFRTALRGDLVSVWRSLRRSSEAGSLGASRLLLETLGVIEGKGAVNLNLIAGGGNGSSAGEKLSDEDLDQEIQGLLLDTGAPDGLEWLRGSLRPALYEVIPDESEDGNAASEDGAFFSADEEADSVRSVVGEAAETG